MSGLTTLGEGIVKALAGEPTRVATLQDYYTWLEQIGPAKVRELLEIEETSTIEFPDGTTLEFVNYYGGLLTAWRRHCADRNWKDEAFTEAREQARAKLLASIEREIEQEEATLELEGER